MEQIIREQFLKITPQQCWDYFATPVNLNDITPRDMQFEITSLPSDKMYAGMLITYVVRPFLRIPFSWCTEITHIREGVYFVDEQRVGPFRIWHHEHHFKAVEGGILMTDILYYDIGKSVLGWLAGLLGVHRRVHEIFEFRRLALEKKFNAVSDGGNR